MFVACGIWCLADVSSVSPSSEQRKLLCSDEGLTLETSQIRRKDSSLAFVSSSLDLSRRTFSARGGGGGAFAPIAPPCLRAYEEM